MMLHRKTTLTSLSMALRATATKAWDSTLYGDIKCATKADYTILKTGETVTKTLEVINGQLDLGRL